jgi:uncharacterized protein
MPQRPDQPASTAHPCPSCGKPVSPDEVHAPFCSKRCRGADLNRWFREDYRVSRPLEEADLDEDV